MEPLWARFATGAVAEPDLVLAIIREGDNVRWSLTACRTCPAIVEDGCTVSFM